MKYTKYLVNGSFIDTRTLGNLPFLLKPLTIPVAFTGLIFLTGMLPIAFTVDIARNVKCRAIRFKRNGYKLQ
jgi:hypothetical protein